MAAVPATNVAEVQIRGTLAGQQVENTFFYRLGTAITQAALDALCAAVSGAFVAGSMDVLPSNYQIREVYGFDRTAGAGTQSTYTGDAGTPGTAGGTALPNNATIAIARKSGERGRNRNGRIYWPGMTTAMLVNPNTVLTSIANDIIDNLEQVDAAAIALEWTPVIISTVFEGHPLLTALITPIAQWVLTDLTLDSRRKRLPGRGV